MRVTDRFALLVVLLALLGCQRQPPFTPEFPGEEPADATCEELGRRFLGEYSLAPSGRADELDDPNLSRSRLVLLADRTFRLTDLPAESFSAHAAADGGGRVSGEGSWRAASDEGGFVYHLRVGQANGRPTSLSLLFRPGARLSVLSSVDNRTHGQFLRRATGNARP